MSKLLMPRQSAFLRSENLKLKEKIQEFASTCKQMENHMQLYQSQLEVKKKMQVDLEKELQSSFNEITKLTSLIDGKVPKGILSFQTYLFLQICLYIEQYLKDFAAVFQ